MKPLPQISIETIEALNKVHKTIAAAEALLQIQKDTIAKGNPLNFRCENVRTASIDFDPDILLPAFAAQIDRLNLDLTNLENKARAELAPPQIETTIENTASIETGEAAAPPNLASGKHISLFGKSYPIIKQLSVGHLHGRPTAWLIAHPNGPALATEDMLSTLEIHSEDGPETRALKREAINSFIKWSWPKLYPEPL